MGYFTLSIMFVYNQVRYHTILWPSLPLATFPTFEMRKHRTAPERTGLIIKQTVAQLALTPMGVCVCVCSL